MHFLNLSFFLVVIAISNLNNFTNGFKRATLLKAKASHLFGIKKHDDPLETMEIVGNHIEVTPDLKDRVYSKIGKVVRVFGKNVASSKVVLRLHGLATPVSHHTHTNKFNLQIVEVTVFLLGGAVIHMSQNTDDIYSSIDLISHKLAQSMNKHNKKLRDLTIRNLRKNSVKGSADIPPPSIEDFLTDEELSIKEEEEFEKDDLLSDLDAKYQLPVENQVPKPSIPLEVIRPKLFPMPPISLEDALVAFEYIDHPFYVFRNKDNNNEINVIYRRKEGGVGMIMPQP